LISLILTTLPDARMSTTNSPTMAMKKSVIVNYHVENAIDYYKPLNLTF
jgi:hypothetical protein